MLVASRRSATRLNSTSGPSTSPLAASRARPFSAASELDGQDRPPPDDRIAVVVIMRRLDHDEVELFGSLHHEGDHIGEAGWWLAAVEPLVPARAGLPLPPRLRATPLLARAATRRVRRRRRGAGGFPASSSYVLSAPDARENESLLSPAGRSRRSAAPAWAAGIGARGRPHKRGRRGALGKPQLPQLILPSRRGAAPSGTSRKAQDFLLLGDPDFPDLIQLRALLAERIGSARTRPISPPAGRSSARSCPAAP